MMNLNEFETRVCYSLNVTEDAMNKNITYRVIAFNQGSSVASDPSNLFKPVPYEEGIHVGFIALFAIIGIAVLVLMILAFKFIRQYIRHQI